MNPAKNPAKMAASESEPAQPCSLERHGSDAPLTDAQIEHWRNMLYEAVGPYALIMPAADIQRYRDIVQRRVLGHPNDADEARR